MANKQLKDYSGDVYPKISAAEEQFVRVASQTTWFDTGLSFVPSKTGYYVLTAWGQYNNGEPIGIAIGEIVNANVWTIIAKTEKDSWSKGVGDINASGILKLTAGKTYRVFAKCASVSSTGNVYYFRHAYLEM